MAPQRPTRQRSFRISADVLDLLDDRAVESGDSANRLAEQILHEGLRTRNHPLIFFRGRASDDRRPSLAGTRLYVWHVIATVRETGGSIEEAAEYFRISPLQVKACVSYYAEFKDEVDGFAEEERAFGTRAQARAQREQEVLG